MRILDIKKAVVDGSPQNTRNRPTISATVNETQVTGTYRSKNLFYISKQTDPIRGLVQFSQIKSVALCLRGLTYHVFRKNATHNRSESNLFAVFSVSKGWRRKRIVRRQAPGRDLLMPGAPKKRPSIRRVFFSSSKY